MRQMSQDQWVAFDVGSDEPHEHGIAGRKTTRTTVKKIILGIPYSKIKPELIHIKCEHKATLTCSKDTSVLISLSSIHTENVVSGNTNSPFERSVL